MPAYLMHHGIKGQKWGIRRFQNEDGSLTDAGRRRYDNSDGTANSVTRAAAKSSFTGRRHIAENRVARLERKSQKARDDANYDYTKDGFTKEESDSIRAASQRKADKLARKAEGQRQANANRKEYESRTSTGKLIAQDILLTKSGAQNYRAARARGEGRIRSLLETNAGVTPISTLLAARGNKKAYGSSLVLSGINDDRNE